MSDKIWCEKNKEHIRNYNRKYREGHRGYFVDYRKKNKEHIREQDKAYYVLNAEKVKNCQRKCYRLHAERERKRSRKYYHSHLKEREMHRRDVRFKVLMIVGKGVLHCSECSCDDVRILDVNHKDGGGTKELKCKGNQFYLDIIKGTRGTDDLNLLCKVCNQVHYLNLKYGAKYNIKYLGGEGKKIQEGTVGSVLKASL